MAKSFDRNSYGSARRSATGSRNPRVANVGAERVASADPRARRASAALSAGAPASGGNPYSRGSYGRDYAKDRKRKKRRRIVMTSLIVVLVLVLGGAGAAFAYINSIQSNLQNDIDPAMLEVLSDTSKPGEPFYMVLMGTDKSAERDAGDELDGIYRTDSIMLLRVDPKEKKVSAVSLMRDTMVDMGEYGTQKLNSAYSFGGAAYTVEMVSKLAGVPVSHYAEVDFDGFADIVDALNGIDVNVPVEIDDDMAGGYVAAGQQTLNGEQALILCRSRHTYDEYGKGDEYRAANQRMVIGAIARKILDSDLATMVNTVQALSQYVTTDLGVTDILSLANNMRGMNMDTDFYSAVNPTVSQYIDDIWWEIMDESAWRTMMRRIDQGLPPTEEDYIDEATGMVMASAGGGATADQSSGNIQVRRSGTVSVKNGTSITGAASAAQEKIAELGYTCEAGNADNANYSETVVVYNTADQREYAQEIADALGVGHIVQNNNEYLFTADYLVVIGADWQ